MRPSWDETWLAVADTIAQRSHCVRRQAGCLIVSSTNRVVAAGYNGPPANYSAAKHGIRSHLDIGSCDQWCPRAMTGGSMSYDDCPSVHSEANALMHADRSLMEGGTIYISSCPCFTCAKNIANSGVKRVVLRVTEADRDRHPELSLDLLRHCGVEVTVVENVLT